MFRINVSSYIHFQPNKKGLACYLFLCLESHGEEKLFQYGRPTIRPGNCRGPKVNRFPDFRGQKYPSRHQRFGSRAILFFSRRERERATQQLKREVLRQFPPKISFPFQKPSYSPNKFDSHMGRYLLYECSQRTCLKVRSSRSQTFGGPLRKLFSIQESKCGSQIAAIFHIRVDAGCLTFPMRRNEETTIEVQTYKTRIIWKIAPLVSLLSFPFCSLAFFWERKCPQYKKISLVDSWTI